MGVNLDIIICIVVDDKLLRVKRLIVVENSSKSHFKDNDEESQMMNVISVSNKYSCIQILLLNESMLNLN